MLDDAKQEMYILFPKFIWLWTLLILWTFINILEQSLGNVGLDFS